MMIKNIFLSTIFLPLLCFSQNKKDGGVPGYQGKRKYIGYHCDLSLAASQINSSYGISGKGGFANFYLDVRENPSQKPIKPKMFAFNLTHNVQFQFVNRRNMSVGGSFKFLKSAMWLDSLSEYNSYDPNASSFVYPASVIDIKAYGFLLTIKKYFNDLAPLGAYYSFSTGPTFISTRMPARKDGGSEKDIKAINFVLGQGLGKQNIFKGKILVDRGVFFDYIGLFQTVMLENRVGAYFNELPEEYYNNNSKSRIAMRNSINLYFSVNYLF